MDNIYYFDNSATTKTDEEVLKVMLPYFAESYGNPSSIYTFGKKARKLLEESRTIIAECIGANPEEIYFTIFLSVQQLYCFQTFIYLSNFHKYHFLRELPPNIKAAVFLVVLNRIS